MEESIAPADTDRIEPLILLLRGRKVIIDADLARLYGIPTKRLNEQIRRNRHRFPDDFVFQTTPEEKEELVAKRDRFKMLKHSTVLPMAFTEFGAAMAATVLNSDAAVQTSVFIVRAFFKMRDALAAGVEIGQKLAEHDHRLDEHDESIRDIVAAIRALALPAKRPVRKIGFNVEEDGG